MEPTKRKINLPAGAEILHRTRPTASPELAEELARRGASESLVRALEGETVSQKHNSSHGESNGAV